MHLGFDPSAALVQVYNSFGRFFGLFAQLTAHETGSMWPYREAQFVDLPKCSGSLDNASPKTVEPKMFHRLFISLIASGTLFAFSGCSASDENAHGNNVPLSTAPKTKAELLVGK
jgi:hypothetical protein